MHTSQYNIIINTAVCILCIPETTYELYQTSMHTLASTYLQYAGIYCLPLRPSPVPWSLKTSTRITSVGRCKQYMGSGAAYSGKRPRTSYSHCWFVSSPRPSLIKLLEQLQQQYAYHGALVVEVAYVRGIFHTYYQLVKIILLYSRVCILRARTLHTQYILLEYSSTLVHYLRSWYP